MSRRVCGPPANTRIDTPRTSRSTSSNGPPGAVNSAVSRAFSVPSACPPAVAVRGEAVREVGSALTTAAALRRTGSDATNAEAAVSTVCPRDGAGTRTGTGAIAVRFARSGLLGLGLQATGLRVERAHLGLDLALVLERVLTGPARAPPPGHQE